MADMRLIVAGAGGRMGRALTRVIAETPGAVLSGAAGYIASHTWLALQQAGYPVKALVRTTSDVKFLSQYNVETVAGARD